MQKKLAESHYLIVSPTNSGKTNLLINMNMRWLDCPKLTIYTTSRDQEKYQILSEFYESIGLEECVELREPDDVIPVKELDTNTETVVFDDIRLDSKSLNPIKEYFSAI